MGDRVPQIEATTRVVAVVTNNSVDIPKTRGIYVGLSGNVKVDTGDGSTVTFVGLAAGVIHPICAKRVYATGTTADNILAVY